MRGASPPVLAESDVVFRVEIIYGLCVIRII